MHEETENVTCDEDFGDPVGADDGVACRVGAHDEATEDHVDGCCEENRRNEDEDGLDDVRGLIIEVSMSSCASCVADGLEL